MDKFCTEEEFLQIVVDGKKEVFDEVLSRVYQKAVESSLVYLPTAMDKLNRKMAYTSKIFGEFLKDHPEYKDNSDVLLQVVQRLELEFPTLPIDEILKKAKPEIDRKIKTLNKMKEAL